MPNPESHNAGDDIQDIVASSNSSAKDLSAKDLTASAQSGASLAGKADFSAHTLHYSQHSQLQTILSHIADGVLMVDRSGVVIFENAASRRIMATSLVGRNLTTFAPPWTLLDAERKPYAHEKLPLVRAIVYGETIRAEDIIVPVSAEVEFVIQVSAAPILNEHGEQLSSVLTLHDVTDERRLTRELREMNRSKDEFLAILSHELRTPLTPILGWASLLQQVGSSNPEVLKQAVTSIERNAELLKRLVSDLLDTTRIVSGKLRTEKGLCDLNETAQFAAHSVEDQAREYGVRLKCDLAPDLPLLLLDRERIQQVLMNLLANAAKFSAPGSFVVLRTRLENASRENQALPPSLISSTRWAIVEVEDNGAGIAPELLPHVFDLFRQGDSSFTRRHGGLGLGLAISKSLVEIHGGTLTVHSEGLEKGARFVVTLPVSDEASAGRTTL